MIAPAKPCPRCAGRGTVAEPAAWLRDARVRAGLKLREASALSGLSICFLSSVERGKQPISHRARIFYEGLNATAGGRARGRTPGPLRLHVAEARR